MLGFTRVAVILGFLMSLKVYCLHGLLSKIRSTQPTGLRRDHINKDVNEGNATDVTTVENDDFEIIFLMSRAIH